MMVIILDLATKVKIHLVRMTAALGRQPVLTRQRRQGIKEPEVAR